MPQTVTFSLKTTFKDGGPKIPDVTRENMVGTNMSLMEEILNDKNWTEFDVPGGNRDRVEFLMLAADRYKDQHCPREDEPGLLFKFAPDDIVLKLDGPLLYAGHTVSCLPPKIEKIYIQNRMSERVKFYLLLGQKPIKNKNANGMTNGTPATNGAAAAAPATPM